MKREHIVMIAIIAAIVLGLWKFTRPEAHAEPQKSEKDVYVGKRVEIA